VRKVQGPILDTFYGRLKKCGDLGCNGKPFTEHHNVPDLRPSDQDGRLDWEQVADGIRAAIESGTLPVGADLPSVRDLQEWQGICRTTLQRAFRELSDEGLIVVRQGRTAVVTGDVPEDSQPGLRRWRPGPGHDCTLAGCARHVCSPMKPGTIRQIHSILSGAFDAAKRWKWVDENPAESARSPTVRHVKRPATSPADVAKVIARKDTKTHQDRLIALDEASVAFVGEHLEAVGSALATVGLELAQDAYLFSNDPMHAAPWNPDWASHKVSDLADAAGVELNIKTLRHYTASQLLAARFDLQNTAARLGHGGGGATTLKHYADPVSEVDRRAAVYLAQLTGAATVPLAAAGDLVPKLATSPWKVPELRSSGGSEDGRVSTRPSPLWQVGHGGIDSVTARAQGDMIAGGRAMPGWRLRSARYA